MRTSKRDRILDAAVNVINRDGVRAVTFESVAAEANLTRGGLLYHFPSREALLRGIDEHLVQAWETSMEKLLGKRADEATALERYQTFVRVSAQSATRAELMFMLESADPEAGERPWGPAVRRWAPSAPEAGNVDPTTLDNFVARLAADGLWIYEAMYEGQLDEGVRARVAERIAGLLAKSDGTSS
ncbi:TPA: TetR/AcrR family transcriptional regulator [Stenotrophomonas maltophilia]|jgi:AcrR family transcriptional regulator|uniref:TetR/AcrR family transcriptional regulator n=1 Tax=Stenotrophomonas maltophilia TaxID=40324 RepID=UPI000C14F2DB|nr:TetR/AcrR family transcriptional regulator [Stenotrophomonas maltophilia]MBA0232693.1 TetR/AcrR family transcriptional regulator [Stenotrophomonas maltophilia]MBA0266639.1 TetR/AcrR family transcriptional regulator [Stenotrophomonas maltophilia]MBA0330551.1 TetR/AcrR family transcriptional regulator [Stenotrophomonas maltophilia]MBH1383806.1 TetR/AcrR family transcriptional regulator [Stenotrophomonas maltophilia]MBN5105052.1 TetR/AcrR family transcriptional regulator [Stenotrophomonas malt